MFYFYTPWKHQKTSGFLMFPRGIDVKHWLIMGYIVRTFCKHYYVELVTEKKIFPVPQISSVVRLPIEVIDIRG